MDNVDAIIEQAVHSYDTCVRAAHSALQSGTLDMAFMYYSSAVSYAWRITLLLSDDDTTGVAFWRNEMNNVQQLCTALAVVLKAREMTLPNQYGSANVGSVVD